MRQAQSLLSRQSYHCCLSRRQCLPSITTERPKTRSPESCRNPCPRVFKAMASVGLQEKLNGSSSCSNERRLWETIQRVYSQAEKSGAISQISSKPSRLEDGGSGLHFVLQIAEQLKDKPKDPSAKSGSEKKPADVFEAFDEDLNVDNEFTPTHMLRLNKFNVIPFHSLTITRHFESQQAPLSFEDWEATHRAMKAYPGGAIAYYNSGEEAGASQPRKHLQILPASLEGSPTAPLTFESAIETAFKQAGSATSQALPLRALPFQSFGTILPDRLTAADLHEACSCLLEARPESTADAAFNVLTAHRFMMLVPRKQESFGPISCNALVFAGTMLVRSSAELDFINERSPLQLIQAVTFPWEAS